MRSAWARRGAGRRSRRTRWRPPPGNVIATTSVETLNVYTAPGDPTPSRTLSRWSACFSPLTVLVTGTTGIGDVQWLKVALPVQPNGTTGWIHATDVTTSSTDLSIHVFLDERTLELRRGDEVILTTQVVVGADKTPTPTGLFYITDPLDFSANPQGVMALVLGTSFILLMIGFRSIVIPATGIVLNLLSTGAADGLLVAVFQPGWGAGILGMPQVDGRVPAPALPRLCQARGAGGR